jgi:DNA-binding CsgD family transcriptional regulator
MTAGYDEWSAARAPSLLAFATAICGDGRTADVAVARALERIRGSWSRVVRDDPGLEARRQVVRACATRRRGAVVLRVLEGRSDAEIAEVLHCSESAARRHLRRGLADPRREVVSAESADVRRQLVARAGSASTQLPTRPPHIGAPAAGGGTRSRIWLAVLAVIAVLGGVAYVAHESRTPEGAIGYPRVDVPRTWRYESYAGVQLQVPDTWGWGGSPMRSAIFSGRRHLGSCGTDLAAVLSPADDSSYVSALTPFVGRPAVLTQRCVPWGSAGTIPRADAVWFDSPLAAGVKGVESTVAETRAVGDQHVSVFSRSSTLRRQILGSVEQVDVDANGCPTAVVARPVAGPRDLQPDSLSVCVYSQDTGVALLEYSGSRPRPSATAYAGHVDPAPTGRGARCPTPSGRWVALGLNSRGGTRWDVANLGCGRIVTAGGRSVPMSPTTVRDWAVGGVTACVGPPRGGDRGLSDYFMTPSG